MIGDDDHFQRGKKLSIITSKPVMKGLLVKVMDRCVFTFNGIYSSMLMDSGWVTHCHQS